MRPSETDLLRRAAAAAAPRWPAFARYCTLRERGLRGPALTAATAFCDACDNADFEARRAFVAWLLPISMSGDWPHDGEILLPRPVLRRVVTLTLLDWVWWEPADAEPHRWLGELALGHGTRTVLADAALLHFREALGRDPDHEGARRGIVAAERRLYG